VLVQWWYGYGQRLNRYNQLDDEVRIGLVLND
jgi:outer membrane phospholipase A